MIFPQPVKSSEYRALLERLASVGDRVIALRQAGKEHLEASVDAQAAYLADQVQPVCREFAQILNEARRVLPAVHREHARLSLKAQGAENSPSMQSAVQAIFTNCLNELGQVERRVRSLGFLPAPSPNGDSVDLTHLGRVLAMTLPGTQYTMSNEEPSGVVIQGATHQCDAVVMAVARDMLTIATKFRETQQRRVEHINAYDPELSFASEEPQSGTDVGIILRGYPLNFSCDSAGILRMGIPVPKSDLKSLARLKQQVELVYSAYEPLLHDFGAKPSTCLIDPEDERGSAFVEYTLALTFSGQIEVPSTQQILGKYFGERSVVINDLVDYRRWSSLRQQTAAGCNYFLRMNEDILAEGRLVGGTQMRSVIESLVDLLGADSVGIEKVGSSPDENRSRNSSSFDGEGEPPFPASNFAPDEDQDGVSGGNVGASGPTPVYVIQLSTDQRALAGRSDTPLDSVLSRCVRRVRAISSKGFQGAAATLVRPHHAAPSTNLIVSDTVLQDEEAMRLFGQLAWRCQVGKVHLTCSPKRLRSYLQAAIRAVDEYIAEARPTERMSLDLLPVMYEDEASGWTIPSVCVQLKSLSGEVMAEGAYSPSKERFDMVSVPQTVIEPLSGAFADSAIELVRTRGVIRVVDLGQELEERGFIIASSLLIHIFGELKKVEVQEVAKEELRDGLRVVLELLLSRTKTRPISYSPEGVICYVLTDEDLPPSERSQQGGSR